MSADGQKSPPKTMLDEMLRAPPRRLNVTPAQRNVRRGQFSVTLVLVLALAGVGWYMLHTSAGMFRRTVRSSRQAMQQAASPADLSRRLQDNAKERAAELEKSVRDMSERIRAIARGAGTPQEVERLLGELDVATQQLDVTSLTELSQRTTSLLNQLNESYEVHIVNGSHGKSGIDGYFEETQGKRVSAGYYVIVEARDANGNRTPRRIRNGESQQTEHVSRWAERVPREVYDRIKADKKADGILNETLFAVKRRGYQNEEIKLIGSDNQPLSRLGQITKW